MKLLGITRTVANLAESKQFYEEVLGFTPDVFFEQTNWQSYRCQDGIFFAVGEKPGSTDEIAFGVADVDALWLKVKDKVDVVSPLEKTPWGTYRFVIRDPDGHLMSFGQQQSD
jgi:catechol 2,3-dioxygenase-like lactoylglutathione lyase family enzyme